MKSFIFAGVLPLLGFVSLAAVFVKAWHDYSQPGFNYSKPFLGIQVPIAMGIGGLVLGGLLMLWAWTRHRGFFRRSGVEAAPPDALEQPPAIDAIAPQLPPPTRPSRSDVRQHRLASALSRANAPRARWLGLRAIAITALEQ